ncbi:hypothetical protein A2602_02770 [candidate division WWE3 bacterium RIFOXYD1_FULL_40_11]|nr:MAG: hypothetical protein A2602_02770 [candidate division WWE3 bacterium RIFOXYD1_FULL_40_11]
MLLSNKKEVHVRGIVRAVNTEINAVRRELDNLVKTGIFKRRQSMNRIYYSVDRLNPFYNELLNLLAKETGLAKKILQKKSDLGDIEFAVFCPAYFKGRESTALDVDLFIVGDIEVEALKKLVKEQESKSGRELNFSVMTSTEFKSRKRTGDQFINRVLSQSRMMLVGDEEKFYSIS